MKFRWPKTWQEGLFHLATLGFIAGFLLTILSWSELCSSSCAEVHFYKFFGWTFELVGLIFFLVAGLLHVASKNRPALSILVSIMLAGALGSELNFIRVQRDVIGAWCPVCLTIAAILVLIVLIYIALFYIRLWMEGASSRRVIMQTLKKGFFYTIFLMIGFVVSYVGVFKPEKTFADGISDDKDPIFGDKSSSIEVYIITDWFCPSCSKIEPMLRRTLPRVMKKSKVFFIDFPIHQETMNYTPYNLSFMVNNKKDYLKIRQVLHRLAKKTKTPSQEQVEKAVEPLGVKYEPLNYADISSGIRFSEGIVKTFKVNATPTIVITNRKKMDGIKLVGPKITQKNLMDAIDKVKKG